MIEGETIEEIPPQDFPGLYGIVDGLEKRICDIKASRLKRPEKATEVCQAVMETIAQFDPRLIFRSWYVNDQVLLEGHLVRRDQKIRAILIESDLEVQNCTFLTEKGEIVKTRGELGTFSRDVVEINHSRYTKNPDWLTLAPKILQALRKEVWLSEVQDGRLRNST